jgi:uncharacterized protein YndB with AHSA1/START domain
MGVVGGPVKTVKIIALGTVSVLTLAAVGLAVALALQPAELSLSRGIDIEAPPEDVWPHLADYQQFVQWSPWSGRDPLQVSEFSDPSIGLGSWYTWAGNSDVGRGRMDTVAYEPPNRMQQRLEFVEPFASVADVTYEVERRGETSRVTWSFRSDNDLMGRAMGLFIDFDAMLGADFDQGLGSLRTRVEAEFAARREAEQSDVLEDPIPGAEE